METPIRMDDFSGAPIFGNIPIQVIDIPLLDWLGTPLSNQEKPPQLREGEGFDPKIQVPKVVGMKDISYGE